MIDVSILETGELVARDDYVQFTATGATWREDAPYEVVQDTYRRLVTLGNRVQWWIGDTLRFAERRYGETYAQMLNETTYSYGALANMKWVAGAIDVHARRDRLSFDHHATVAALPPDEQESWLERAEEQQLSRNALREAIQEAQRPTQVPGLPEDVHITLRFHYAGPELVEVTILEHPDIVIVGHSLPHALEMAVSTVKAVLENAPRREYLTAFEKG